MSDPIFISKEQRAFAFAASLPPVVTIDPGTVVTFETGDVAYNRLAQGESVEDIGLGNFNAVTGPVYINGAEPGDALKIEVQDIQIHSAWSVWLPGFGGLGNRTTDIKTMNAPIDGDTIRISDNVTVPLQPMIGCIGVAPAEGTGSTLGPAESWGGNMDLRELSPGATIYLPVQVPGALLAMGDLHAAMGTGEPTWVSLEAAGQATLRISLEKGVTMPFPRLRVGNEVLFLGMGETINDAYQIALDRAFDYLLTERHMAPFEAYAYASAKVSMRFGGPTSPMVLATISE